LLTNELHGQTIKEHIQSAGPGIPSSSFPAVRLHIHPGVEGPELLDAS
jgi:hypothetical protein